jgi:dienelactone hydrolase
LKNKNKDFIIDSVYYPADAKGGKIAVILVGGSEGGMPTYYDKDMFTQAGYPTLELGYFGTTNTPNLLELIPLEYFFKAIKKFKAYPEVENKKIVIYGGSKGGELALLLGSVNPEINGVIAKVPSSVAFQSINYKNEITSSWSLHGKEIPFMPYAPFDFSTIENGEFLDFYTKSIKQEKYLEESSIKVEKINGPLLLLSGEEDKMWPSTQMSSDIIKRLDNNNFQFSYKHISYKNAGHTLYQDKIMGGNFEGNKLANEDSNKQILNFLNKLNSE